MARVRLPQPLMESKMSHNSRESWSKSLEDVAWESWAGRYRPGKSRLKFSPSRAAKPAPFDDLPVVALVVSQATHWLHDALFESIDFLQRASGAFKVVVFGDSGIENQVRELDWAVETLLPEWEWEDISDKNWLGMAAERLDWLHHTYGTSYVLAVRSPEEALREVLNFSRALAIDGAFGVAAAEHLNSRLGPHRPSEHTSLRGWIDQVPPGSSQHTVIWDATQHHLAIDRTYSEVTLVIDTEISEDLITLARDCSWNLVRVQSPGRVGPFNEVNFWRAFQSGFKPTLVVGVTDREGAPTPERAFTGGIVSLPRDGRPFVLHALGGIVVEAETVQDLSEVIVDLSRAERLSQTITGR